MDLFLLRHGEAGRSLSTSSADSQRRLTEDGRGEVSLVAKAVSGLDLELDVIASSPLSRARETAEIVARRAAPELRVELWEELKPEGDLSALRRRLSRLRRDSTVLLVGHEPAMTSFVADITGAKRGSLLLKKAGLVRVHVVSFSPGAGAQLRWLLSPRVLKKMAG